ncbi:unnamed protein product [Amoebophrya sp. A120]|nr:unnamed protein product [Amoebophrya sp. A120]|eukprot:GSA120T00019199001.1
MKRRSPENFSSFRGQHLCVFFLLFHQASPVTVSAAAFLPSGGSSVATISAGPVVASYSSGAHTPRAPYHLASSAVPVPTASHGGLFTSSSASPGGTTSTGHAPLIIPGTVFGAAAPPVFASASQQQFQPGAPSAFLRSNSSVGNTRSSSSNSTASAVQRARSQPQPGQLLGRAGAMPVVQTTGSLSQHQQQAQRAPASWAYPARGPQHQQTVPAGVSGGPQTATPLPGGPPVGAAAPQLHSHGAASSTRTATPATTRTHTPGGSMHVPLRGTSSSLAAPAGLSVPFFGGFFGGAPPQASGHQTPSPSGGGAPVLSRNLLHNNVRAMTPNTSPAGFAPMGLQSSQPLLTAGASTAATTSPLSSMLYGAIPGTTATASGLSPANKSKEPCPLCFEDHNHPSEGNFVCRHCGAFAHRTCLIPWIVPGIQAKGNSELPPDRGDTPAGETFVGMSLGDVPGNNFVTSRHCPTCGGEIGFNEFLHSVRPGRAYQIGKSEIWYREEEEKLQTVLDLGVDLLHNTEKAAIMEVSRISAAFAAWRSAVDFFVRDLEPLLAAAEVISMNVDELAKQMQQFSLLGTSTSNNNAAFVSSSPRRATTSTTQSLLDQSLLTSERDAALYKTVGREELGMETDVYARFVTKCRKTTPFSASERIQDRPTVKALLDCGLVKFMRKYLRLGAGGDESTAFVKAAQDMSYGSMPTTISGGFSKSELLEIHVKLDELLHEEWSKPVNTSSGSSGGAGAGAGNANLVVSSQPSGSIKPTPPTERAKEQLESGLQYEHYIMNSFNKALEEIYGFSVLEALDPDCKQELVKYLTQRALPFFPKFRNSEQFELLVYEHYWRVDWAAKILTHDTQYKNLLANGHVPVGSSRNFDQNQKLDEVMREKKSGKEKMDSSSTSGRNTDHGTSSNTSTTGGKSSSKKSQKHSIKPKKLPALSVTTVINAGSFLAQGVSARQLVQPLFPSAYSFFSDRSGQHLSAGMNQPKMSTEASIKKTVKKKKKKGFVSYVCC